MPKLTKSQTIILEVLQRHSSGITPKALLEEVDFAPRTVRYALRRLMKMNMVKRIPCLQDMRQHIYVLSN